MIKHLTMFIFLLSLPSNHLSSLVLSPFNKKGNSSDCFKIRLTLSAVSELVLLKRINWCFTICCMIEYAAGGSLADCLQNNYSGNGLPEFQVQKHTKNALLGLVQVHGQGIIHCDIKTHNILLVGDDEVANIADFRLAPTLEQSWSRNHGLRGMKRYMASESMLYHDYGPEVDTWAVGCTVYELLTGEPLWESNENADVLERIESEEPNLENEMLSREVKDFLRSCLVKNPCSRWTADMLLNHPFLKSSKLAESDQPAKARKRKNYMSILHRPHQKRAFKTAARSWSDYRTLI